MSEIEVIGDSATQVSKPATWEENYKGFRMNVFHVNGREGFVIEPHTACRERRYIWRIEFLGAFDVADIAMLNNGWHLVYYNLQNKYGSPHAVELMEKFQAYIENEFKLSPKAVLFGFSRGGLYALHFAAKYPAKVSCIYFDAPVLNIFSWPGNSAKEFFYEAEWAECKKEYRINGDERNEYSSKLIANIKTLIAYKIPVILVAGAADEVVPLSENGAVLAKMYKESETPFKEIIKAGCLHHPHSLAEPDEIVDFILHNS